MIEDDDGADFSGATIHPLVRHPDSLGDGIAAFAVKLFRDGPALLLHYDLIGELDGIVLPPTGPQSRTDGLWRTTCFEAFVQTRPPAYREFNFSPSGAWAAYRFAGYRKGMKPLAMAPPRFALAPAERHLQLVIEIALPTDATWQIGLSAVIETLDGQKSYWALAHPPGPPDFHHRDCFALELPPSPRE